MIEEYLRDLRRALGFQPSERLIAETEQHLREAATEVGEEEAVRRFGPPEAVARPYRARVGWLFAGIVALLALAFPILSYPVVENSLPPAPWPAGQKPEHLAWKQDGVMGLFVLALVAALVAGATWRRAGPVRLAAAGVAASGLVAMAALGAILSVQWADAVPGTPGWLASVWIAQCGLALLAAGLTVRAALLGRPSTVD